MTKPGREYSVDRFLEAQKGPLGVDEAIRQIRTGNISGDWVVWTFPCLESTIKTVLWRQGNFEPGYEDRFRQLNKYALTGRRDAEAYLFHPVLRTNFERICTFLYGCDRDTVIGILKPWMSILWSSLSIFEYLCPESDTIHLLREKLFPDNRDLMSMMYFDHHV